MRRKNHLICGFGENDLDFPIPKSNYTDEEGNFHKKWLDPVYVWWRNAITRAYSEVYHKSFPKYSDVEVCDSWRKLSSFYPWALDKSGGSFKFKVLDKDILGDGKLYSPSTCCLISVKMNSFLIASESVRETPVGVCYEKYTSKYIAMINDLDLKQKKLGRFKTAEEARLVYCRKKLEIAYKLVIQENVEDYIASALIAKLQKKVDEAEILYQQSLI